MSDPLFVKVPIYGFHDYKGFYCFGSMIECYRLGISRFISCGSSLFVKVPV